MIILILDSVDSAGVYISSYPKLIEDHSKNAVFTRFSYRLLQPFWDHIKNCPSSNDIAVKTWAEIEFNKNDKYFYYVACRCAGDIGTPYVLDLLEQEKMQIIADYDITIWYDYSYEYVPKPYINIAEWRQDKWDQTFLQLNSAYSGKVAVSVLNQQSIAKKTPLILFVDYPVWLFLGLSIFNDRLLNLGWTEDLYFSTDKPFTYLSLNRRIRLSRIMLYFGLVARDLCSEGMISLVEVPAPSTIAPENHYFFYGSENCLNQEFRNQLINVMRTTTLQPIRIDNEEHDFNNAYQLDWVTSTCFDIINETVDGSTDSGSMLTEKTVKALLIGKPFLINGGPGALAYLRGLGFRTFPYLFDESYDEIKNQIDRQDIILRNIERWKNDKDEFMRIAREHRDDILFNRHHALSFSLPNHLYHALNSI